MTEWQPIETAPRDGTMFIAKQGDRVFASFFSPNTVHNAKKPETLQVIIQPNSRSAARSWFVPTHWMPLPPPPERIER